MLSYGVYSTEEVADELEVKFWDLQPVLKFLNIPKKHGKYQITKKCLEYLKRIRTGYGTETESDKAHP